MMSFKKTDTVPVKLLLAGAIFAMFAQHPARAADQIPEANAQLTFKAIANFTMAGEQKNAYSDDVLIIVDSVHIVSAKPENAKASIVNGATKIRFLISNNGNTTEPITFTDWKLPDGAALSSVTRVDGEGAAVASGFSLGAGKTATIEAVISKIVKPGKAELNVKTGTQVLPLSFDIQADVIFQPTVSVSSSIDQVKLGASKKLEFFASNSNGAADKPVLMMVTLPKGLDKAQLKAVSIGGVSVNIEKTDATFKVATKPTGGAQPAATASVAFNADSSQLLLSVWMADQQSPMISVPMSFVDTVNDVSFYAPQTLKIQSGASDVSKPATFAITPAVSDKTYAVTLTQDGASTLKPIQWTDQDGGAGKPPAAALFGSEMVVPMFLKNPDEKKADAVIPSVSDFTGLPTGTTVKFYSDAGKQQLIPETGLEIAAKTGHAVYAVVSLGKVDKPQKLESKTLTVKMATKSGAKMDDIVIQLPKLEGGINIQDKGFTFKYPAPGVVMIPVTLTGPEDIADDAMIAVSSPDDSVAALLQDAENGPPIAKDAAQGISKAKIYWVKVTLPEHPQGDEVSVSVNATTKSGVTSTQVIPVKISESYFGQIKEHPKTLLQEMQAGLVSAAEFDWTITPSTAGTLADVIVKDQDDWTVTFNVGGKAYATVAEIVAAKQALTAGTDLKVKVMITPKKGVAAGNSKTVSVALKDDKGRELALPAMTVALVKNIESANVKVSLNQSYDSGCSGDLAALKYTAQINNKLKPGECVAFEASVHNGSTQMEATELELSEDLAQPLLYGKLQKTDSHVFVNGSEDATVPVRQEGNKLSAKLPKLGPGATAAYHFQFKLNSLTKSN